MFVNNNEVYLLLLYSKLQGKHSKGLSHHPSSWECTRSSAPHHPSTTDCAHVYLRVRRSTRSDIQLIRSAGLWSKSASSIRWASTMYGQGLHHSFIRSSYSPTKFQHFFTVLDSSAALSRQRYFSSQGQATPPGTPLCAVMSKPDHFKPSQIFNVRVEYSKPMMKV